MTDYLARPKEHLPEHYEYIFRTEAKERLPYSSSKAEVIPQDSNGPF